MTAALALIATAGTAHAQSTWNNTAGGNWNVASNWLPAGVPNSISADVTIGLTDPFTVLCNLSPSVGTLAITNPLAVLDIEASRSLTIAGGSFHNDALLRINPTGSIFNSSLIFSASTAVTGSGALFLGALSGNPDILDAQIQANASTTVSFGPDQLISGNGTMTGLGEFVVQGLVQPTGPASPGIQLRTSLTLDPGAEIDVSNARFELGPSAVLTGGRVFGSGGHALQAAASITRISDLTLDASFDIVGGAYTTALDGTLTNNDTITINSSAQIFNATLRFDTNTTISGNGSIVMQTVSSTDDAQITSAAGVTGTIGSGQAVSGSGRISGDLILEGSMTADDPAANLELRGTLAGPGTLRAANGAFLSFLNATLTDLTIETETLGVVGADVGTSSVSGMINNGDAVIVGGSTTLALSGPFTNNGTLTINNDQRIFDATLRFDIDTTIGGNGSIVMRTAGNANDAQITSAAGVTGTIGAGQSISGSGRISADLSVLGSITADDPAANLEILGSMTGPGLLRAENDAFLAFNSADLANMTIETETGGVVGAAAGTSTINGMTINGQAVIAGGSTTLALIGDLTNNGTLTLNFDNRIFDAILQFDASCSILGNGTVRMVTSGDLSDARVVVSGTHTATIGVGQTVAGSGVIDGDFLNLGTINADDPSQILDLRATIGGPGTVRADGSRATMNNAYLSNQTFASTNGGIVTARTGISTIENSHNTGTLGIDGNSATLMSVGTLTNDGTILINATDTIFNAVLELADAAGIDGTGDIILETSGDLGDALIRVPDPQSSTTGASQSISGSGRISGNLAVLGQIRPAGDLRNVNINSGTLTLGADATSTFDIGGTPTAQFGQLTVANAAAVELNGTCVVRIDNGYNPVRGDSWDIVTAQNRTGEFTDYDLPVAPFGSAYRVFYAPGRVFVRLTCSADFDGDNQLNFFDVSSFIGLYNNADPRADLASPFGVFNFFDIAAFINNFNVGCP